MNTSRRFLIACLAVALLVSTTGCQMLFNMLFPQEEFLHPGERYEGQYWKEGYGFNNPNAEKMKDPEYRKSLGR